MILYPDEMERIAKAVRLVQDFHENLTNLYDSKLDVNFEGPEQCTIKVFDTNSEELGVIDWTEHGVIGFISDDHKAK